MSTSRKYITYIEAFKTLSAKLHATKEEFAGWIYLGAKEGGLDAFLDANDTEYDDNPIPKFYFAHHEMERDYLGLLPTLWFERKAIEEFAPSDEARFISAKELLERWNNIPGTTASDFIKAKIKDSSLLDIHPTFGGTQAQGPENADFPPLKEGIFYLSQVVSIETTASIQRMSEDNIAEQPSKKKRSKQAFKEIKSISSAEFPVPPTRKDDWYLAIRDTRIELFSENRQIPNMQQTWLKLCQNPPTSYGISPINPSRETTLYLDKKPLTKESFKRRWDRYSVIKDQ